MKKNIVILAFLMIFFHLCGCHQSNESSNIETVKGGHMIVTPEEFFEPNKKDLPSIDLLKQLYCNMPYQEVIKVIGKPQRRNQSSGIGIPRFEWDFNNGEKRSFVFFLSEGDHDGDGSLTNIYYYGFIIIAD